jgi:DNA-binding transcriptional MerR regulator
MNTQGFVAGPLSVLCIVALVMGTASAAVITATGSTSDKGAIPAHLHPSPGSIISHLQQQGVDVTEVKTALQNGDTEAVNAWLEAYFQAHRPERPEGSGRSPPDLTSSTRQQDIITRLEAEGVDVTEAKTALQNGDSDAVQAWLEAYFQAHRPERPGGAGRSPPDLSDPVQEQKIIDRLEERGVDVTEVEADLQSGDTTAVQTWLETYLPSHEGEMGFHHPPEPVNQAGTGE